MESFKDLDSKRLIPKKQTQDTQQPDEPEQYIVQRYIHNPLLIGGRKFDLRLYILVTSFNPLKVYVHRRGYCRFASQIYSTEPEQMRNMMMHATNVSLQKQSEDYCKERGSKWSLRSFRQYLHGLYGHQITRKTFNDIESVLIRSLLAVKSVMISDKRCFELYGYDILLDSDLKPWLLEVNASPSLSFENKQDYETKRKILGDMLNTLHGASPGEFDLVYSHSESIKQTGGSSYNSKLGQSAIASFA